jgi:hypothetical protein
MAYHKFKVGQLVEYIPARSGMPTSGQQYQVLRLLPAEAGQFLYRVKSKGEAFERVAKEGELSHRAPA